MSSGGNRIGGWVGVLALLFAASPALAQSSPALVLPAPSAPPSARDLGGDAGGLSGFVLAAPLRLSLQGSIAPRGDLFPNCASREDDVGNSVGGVPVQHFFALRLSQRLVLSIFTQLGCPIDAGIGTSLSYVVPVSTAAWFVLSAGAYVAPAQTPLFGDSKVVVTRALQGAPSSASVAGRADIFWKPTPSSDRTYNFGVESRGRGTQSVTFGSGF